MVVLTLLLDRVKRSQASRLVIIGVACLLIGAALFSATQHVSYFTGVYWAITTATTVGYGDVTPKNPAGRGVAIGVMLTTIPLFASAFALFAGAVAASHLRRLLSVADEELRGGEVVIFGFHPAVPRIATELIRAGRKVVVVTNGDRSTLPDAARVIAADPTSEEGLRRSHADRAAQLLVAGATDAEVLVTAVLVRQAAPDVPTLAIAHSSNVSKALGELGIAATVSAEDLLGHTLAKSLEAPHAAELLLRLVDSEGYELRELAVEGAGCAGHPLSRVRTERDGLVLGAVHEGRVVLGVGQDPVLADGDRLLVLEADHPGRARTRSPEATPA